MVASALERPVASLLLRRTLFRQMRELRGIFNLGKLHGISRRSGGAGRQRE
jgi:hypothetical protein